MLGEAEFDLAKYANDQTSANEVLKVYKCDIDNDASVDIFIHATSLEIIAKTPRIVSTMEIIEERSSENDTKDEYDFRIG